MSYISTSCLKTALEQLWGTADHLLKIWLTLKRMGLEPGASPVKVTTSTPNSALNRLFAYGDRDGGFFVPFAHTARFATMKHDAARSIIQTNVKRWQESGSVVTVDPSGFLNFAAGADDEVLVSPSRTYPVGLGWGKNGFARENETRTTVPWLAFCAWHCRQTPIPPEANPDAFIQDTTRTELHLSDAEIEAVFVQVRLDIDVQASKISDTQIYKAVSEHLARENIVKEVVSTTFAEHAQRIKSMVTLGDGPAWLQGAPDALLKNVLDAGAKAVLLYGPPRTGKTLAVDALHPKGSKRASIQIHDGWGYDELMVSMRPKPDGTWAWQAGPLLEAIRSNQKVIVLEEANRTPLTQALGEVFSLLEEKYRGPSNAITLRNGESFYIPEETLIIALINTLDKSTEDLDDAVYGRMAAIEFPPRVEALTSMLNTACIPPDESQRIREFFAMVQASYPLGHGYFATLKAGDSFIPFYKTRVRPVLQAHLDKLRQGELATIDNKVDQLFKL
jgi:5-methylcytosine-specific restriction protein B